MPQYQVGDRTGKLTGGQKQEFEQIAGQMMKGLTDSEEDIYQTKNQSSQDPLNYTIRLNNQIAALTGAVSSGDYRPTKQAYEAFDMLGKELDVQLKSARKTYGRSPLTSERHSARSRPGGVEAEYRRDQAAEA